MKVGIALNMLCQDGARRLGGASIWRWATSPSRSASNSLFALEHHFTGYAMSPAPTQLLSYYAGRTKRIQLGTAVIVLPWHDPVRVAEQIALLDILCGGRCLFGFGRGAARVEYEGFRIPMGEARPRFVEAAQIIVKALAKDSLRAPRASSSRSRAPRSARGRSRIPSGVSMPRRSAPKSAEIMAKLGFGMLMVMQNEWPKAAEDIDTLPRDAPAAGHAAAADHPDQCLLRRKPGGGATSARSSISAGNGSRSTTTTISPTATADVKGYESLRQDGADLRQDQGKRRTAKKATDFYVSIQIVGTPNDCLEKIGELQRCTGHGPPGHRILVRRHAARGGRDQHAPVRRPGDADPATRPGLRRAGRDATDPGPRHAASGGILGPR